MNWFLLALVGPFLYALTNHIDKILLEKYFKESGVGTLILFSSLLSVIALPFIYLGDSTALSVRGLNILVLAFVGLLNIGVLWFYLLALKDDDASVIIVFYQLVPVFGLVLGYFVLDEVISKLQFVAMLIIILGTSIISFEIDSENNFKIRKKTITYMLFASLFWAIGSVTFKAVALEENVWRSLFWEHIMMILIGIYIFMFIPTYRNHFLLALRNNSKAIISLNVANEALYMLGNIVIAFAFMLAPISLILLAESFQSIFVFAIGIFLTIFFPTISKENIQIKNLWQKFFAICITGVGTYILLTA